MQLSHLFIKLKNWINHTFFNHPQPLLLGAGSSVSVEDDNINSYKSVSIEDMSNEEINSILSQDFHLYNINELISQVLLRIGTSKELTQKIIENNQMIEIFKFHFQHGKLISTKNGATILKNNYLSNNVTTIKQLGNSIIIDNTDPYPYFCDFQNDYRLVKQMKITLNNLNGLTLESTETDETKSSIPSVSILDEHNICTGKITKIGPNNVFTSVVTRCAENPFAYKEEIYENFQEDKLSKLTFYGSVSSSYPDLLVSFHNRPDCPTTYREQDIIDIKNIPTVGISDINLNDLERRNPKAGFYFSSLALSFSR